MDLVDIEIQRIGDATDQERLRKVPQKVLVDIHVHQKMTGFMGKEAMKILDDVRVLVNFLPEEALVRLIKFYDLFREIMHYFSTERMFTREETVCIVIFACFSLNGLYCNSRS